MRGAARATGGRPALGGRLLGAALALGSGALGPGAASAQEPAPGRDGADFLEREAVREWVRDAAAERGLDRDRVESLFARLEPDPRVLELISAPAERTLSWREYAPIFLTGERIDAGRAWIGEHREALDAAAARHGVPVPVIGAIVGVETFYGRITGGRSVLRSLATLGFDYPPRADFFRSELGEFLTLVDAQGWDAASITGSYAGAMGLPQFIASSYRAYAVDGDGDGRVDLFDSVPDVAASVANYLARHDWRAGAAVAEPWADAPAEAASLVRESLTPAIEPATLREAGFDSPALDAAEAAGELVSVMRFATRAGDGVEGPGDDATGAAFVVGYNNFHAITRYNRSRLYARAVHELARALDAP